MSEFNGLLNGFNFNSIQQPVISQPEQIVTEINKIGDIKSIGPSETNNICFDENSDKQFGTREKPFDVSTFASEIKKISENKNKIYLEHASSINGYSIAHDCILCTVKKILNYPVPTFANKWLPIMMRSTIGTAIHEFIQNNTSQFTEIEKSIKVPSIRFSGRIDALIGNNVLCEIKSCSYSDYQKILKKSQPRSPDFYQIMTYKYILENHLLEAKNPGVETRTSPPQLDEYKIDTLQFIYIAHDLCAADVEDFSQSIALSKQVKTSLHSKRNDFYFITSVILDTNCFDQNPYITWIKEKIDTINYYVNSNKLPGPNDKFIDMTKCFFCLYQEDCELIKNKK